MALSNTNVLETMIPVTTEYSQCETALHLAGDAILPNKPQKCLFVFPKDSFI